MCAQEALVQLQLETVVWVPVGEAPHREIQLDPGPRARLALCERAVAGDPRFSVSPVEIERPGPSYTADTLRLLGDGDLVLILGGDQAATLPSWHEPEEVLALADVAVAERDGGRREEIADRLAGLGGGERVRFFDMPRIDVSSSLVRERAAAGQPIRYLVPDGVADMIEARGLYSAAVGAR